MAEARREIEREVIQLKKEVDGKIQKAIDNPLANKYCLLQLWPYTCRYNCLLVKNGPGAEMSIIEK